MTVGLNMPVLIVNVKLSLNVYRIVNVNQLKLVVPIKNVYLVIIVLEIQLVIAKETVNMEVIVQEKKNVLLDIPKQFVRLI